jgi:hypothetical protein
MANTYDIGDLVRVTGTFTVSGTATDPTTITLKVLPPGSAVLTYTYALSEVTKSATGVYYKDIPITSSGTWYYRWISTGTVVSAGEEYFHVRVAQAV